MTQYVCIRMMSTCGTVERVRVRVRVHVCCSYIRHCNNERVSCARYTHTVSDANGHVLVLSSAWLIGSEHTAAWRKFFRTTFSSCGKWLRDRRMTFTVYVDTRVR